MITTNARLMSAVLAETNISADKVVSIKQTRQGWLVEFTYDYCGYILKGYEEVKGFCI